MAEHRLDSQPTASTFVRWPPSEGQTLARTRLCYGRPIPPADVAREVGDYVALTKPRIIELLLVTTVPTMVVADEGCPRCG